MSLLVPTGFELKPLLLETRMELTCNQESSRKKEVREGDRRGEGISLIVLESMWGTLGTKRICNKKNGWWRQGKNSRYLRSHLDFESHDGNI